MASLGHPLRTSIPADTSLDVALDTLNSHERRWLPVTDDGEVLGIVDAGDLLRSFRRAAEHQIRPLSPFTAELAAVELILPTTSPVTGRELRHAQLPNGVRVLTYEHQGKVGVADGSTRLAPGDRVTLALPKGKQAEAFRVILGAP